MLYSFILLAMIAGPTTAQGPKLAKPGADINRVICKYDLQPGSRLARRKVCLTVQQWEEWQQSERLYLLRNQFNGSPK